MKHFDLSRTELDMQFFAGRDAKTLETRAKAMKDELEKLTAQAAKLRELTESQIKADALSVRGLAADAKVTWNKKDEAIVSFDVLPETKTEASAPTPPVVLEPEAPHA